MATGLGANNSFKPNLFRYGKSVAGKACHAFASTTQVGLTQVLAFWRHIVVSSNMQFWIGLACAIPLSIFANLLTPRIQDWFAQRSRRASEKRDAIRTKELARINEYIANPIRLNTFLLTTIVVATMLGAGIGVFSAFVYMFGTFGSAKLGTTVAQALSVFGGLLITKICLDAANIAVKVREAQKVTSPES